MKNYRRVFNLTLLLVIILGGVAVQTASAQRKKAKVTYYSIPAGTVFHVRINQKLSSKTNHKGDTFRTTTVDPIYSKGGVVLAPAGSTIYGTVYSAVPSAKDGKPGSLDVRFTSLKLPNNRKAVISGMLTDLDENGTSSDNEGGANASKTSHRNVKFIGGGAAGGAVIGGIAGGGKGAAIGAGVGAVGGFIAKKLKKGSEAEVKSGTEFGVYLSKKIALPRY